MHLRRVLLALIIGSLLMVSWRTVWNLPLLAAGTVEQKIAPQVLADTANGQSAYFLVVLAEQADLSPASLLATRTEKGQYVTDALRSTAERTQQAVILQLDEMRVVYQPYWIVNLIAVKGNRAVVDAMAANPAVSRIEPDRAFRGLSEPIGASIVTRAPKAPEWGILRINADDVWALGYTGNGISIGHQDTGVDWEHSAIRSHYRGWNGSGADHNYHWWDAIHEDIDGASNPCGYSLPAPCDDSGHGTHTAGTLIGDDGTPEAPGPNQIGVAPGAKLIACRSMDSGIGRPHTYLECFQFFAAPTNLAGQNPNPALAPAVISNSWGCPLGSPPSGEGCVPDSFLTVIENLRAAGIVTVVLNGNSGSACATTLSPPAYFEAAISVGFIASNDTVSNLSSRGPVTADGSNRIKPDLVAPGSAVRSSIRGGGYATLTGSSMAAPHVAGAVALLIDARPDLDGNVDAIEDALFQSAFHLVQTEECGGIPGNQFPNNTVGYGRLDVLAAIQGGSEPTATPTQTPEDTFSLAGRITDRAGVGIRDVLLTLGAQTATTNAQGEYVFEAIPIGEYGLVPSRVGLEFYPPYRTVALITNMINQDFTVGAPRVEECAVPFFSQNDPRWKDHPLRTAGACGADCNTIGKCGCTLTSAAMVFAYYGSDITPETLSDCMGNAACPFDWSSGANCSGEVATALSALPFSYEVLDRELNQYHRPVLLKLCKNGNCGSGNTHWVVITSGKGNMPDNYRMNDPWHPHGYDLLLTSRTNLNYVPTQIARYDGVAVCDTASGSVSQAVVYVPDATISEGGITGDAVTFAPIGNELTIQMSSQSSFGNVNEMKVWTSNIPPDTWQPFQTLISLPLSDAVVNVQFRDEAGNVSEIYQTSVNPISSPPDASPISTPNNTPEPSGTPSSTYTPGPNSTVLPTKTDIPSTPTLTRTVTPTPILELLYLPIIMR